MNEQFILALVEKFGQGNLAELDIKEGDLHIQLRKDTVGPPALPPTEAEPPAEIPALQSELPLESPPAPPQTPPSRAETSEEPPPAQSPAKPPAKAPAGPPASLEPGVEIITSPIVATFYTSPGPDVPPFVSPGSQVKAGDTLCILEAMKMMNHLEAEFDGEILAVLAESGDLVEYGQALFEIRRL